jgi:hypothetical protein
MVAAALEETVVAAEAVEDEVVDEAEAEEADAVEAVEAKSDLHTLKFIIIDLTKTHYHRS